MIRCLTLIACLGGLVAAPAGVALAQKSVADLLDVPVTSEGQRKTFLAQTPGQEMPATPEAAPAAAEPRFLVESLKGTWLGQAWSPWAPTCTAGSNRGSPETSTVRATASTSAPTSIGAPTTTD